MSVTFRPSNDLNDTPSTSSHSPFPPQSTALGVHRVRVIGQHAPAAHVWGCEGETPVRGPSSWYGVAHVRTPFQPRTSARLVRGCWHRVHARLCGGALGPCGVQACAGERVRSSEPAVGGGAHPPRRQRSRGHSNMEAGSMATDGAPCPAENRCSGGARGARYVSELLCRPHQHNTHPHDTVQAALPCEKLSWSTLLSPSTVRKHRLHTGGASGGCSTHAC